MVAGEVGVGQDAALVIIVRDPGRGFAPPARVKLPADAFLADDAVAVGVAPGGEAVVAWTELRHGATRVRVVTRQAGGALGPAETVLTTPDQDIPLAVAVDPDGTATLAWSRDRNLRPARRHRGQPRRARRAVRVAAAAAGRSGTPGRSRSPPPRTAACCSSRVGGIDSVRVFARAPGEPALHAGPRFRGSARPYSTASPSRRSPPAAPPLWRGNFTAVKAAARSGSRCARRAPRSPPPVGLAGSGTAALHDVRDVDTGAALAAAVAGDGGVIVGWLATSHRFAHDRLVRAWAATGSVTDGLGEPRSGQ